LSGAIRHPARPGNKPTEITAKKVDSKDLLIRTALVVHRDPTATNREKQLARGLLRYVYGAIPK
jgi:hypothetical protein